MKLRLEIEINTKQFDDLNVLSQLIREGWDIQHIGEASLDRANKDMKFTLTRLIGQK